MTITLMGYLLIPLGMVLLFLKTEKLLLATVFFAAFTGSSVVNFDGFGYSLQPAYFFAILLIFKLCFHIMVLQRDVAVPNKYLMFFMMACSLSLIMPFLLASHDVVVLNPDNQYVSLSFTLQHITQFIYILFCFILYVSLKTYFKDNRERMDRGLRTLLYSGLVVSLLGIYQEIAYLLSLPFDAWFRSGLHTNVQPYGPFIRVSSVANEPSMYALFISSLLAFMVWIERNFFKYKVFLIVLLMINGVLSTSTSFVLGVAVLAVVMLAKKIKSVYSKEDRVFLKRMLFAVVIFSAILVIGFQVSPQIRNLLTTDIIEKFMGINASGSERISAFLHHLQVGLQYPILGVGFGSARSKDLFSTFLANTGFVGISLFLLYFMTLIAALRRCGQSKFQGLASFLLVNLAIMLVSVPEPYFLYLWTVFALSESYVRSEATSLRKGIEAGP